jgi:hypothetical protein
MTLEAGDLLHVLPGGFHRIRHYGPLSNPVRRASLATVRELLHRRTRARRGIRRRRHRKPAYLHLPVEFGRVSDERRDGLCNFVGNERQFRRGSFENDPI